MIASVEDVLEPTRSSPRQATISGSARVQPRRQKGGLRQLVPLTATTSSSSACRACCLKEPPRCSATASTSRPLFGRTSPYSMPRAPRPQLSNLIMPTARCGRATPRLGPCCSTSTATPLRGARSNIFVTATAGSTPKERYLTARISRQATIDLAAGLKIPFAEDDYLSLRTPTNPDEILPDPRPAWQSAACSFLTATSRSALSLPPDHQ